MLSIYTLKSAQDASTYYQKDNYYSNENEASNAYSAWHGKGAENLKLQGKVDFAQFKETLEGKLPNGIQMHQTKNGGHHRPGYDLTFSAPKSVSILALVGGDERVVQAHRNAVTSVLTQIEKQYAAVRSKKSGVVHIEKTDNLCFATFEHTDSRALDPNLHTHSIVMNFSQRTDGQWRTIYGDKFYDNKILNGMEYRAALAKELMSLGFRLVQTSEKGTFELEGFNSALIGQFSKRRQQIESKLAAMEQSGGKAAKMANFLTRSTKKTMEPEHLKLCWENELKEAGSSVEWLKSYSQQANERGPVIPNSDLKQVAGQAINSAIKHLEEQKSIFSSPELLKTALGMTLINCSSEQLGQAIQERIESKALLPLGNTLYTTPLTQARERTLADYVHQDKRQVQPISGSLYAKVTAFFNFRDKNLRNGLKHILTSADRQTAIQSSSKEDYFKIMKAFSQSCKENRFYPIFITQSNVSKETIQQQTGINRIYSMGGFLEACNRRSEKIKSPAIAQKQYQAKQLWVVDLDPKTSVKQALELQERAKTFGARILWSNDVSKPNPVFSLLTKAGINTVSINSKLRDNQKDESFILAAKIKKLQESKHIQSIGDPQERMTQAVDKYIFLPQGKKALLVSTQADRKVVNERIREQLVTQGKLGQESVTIKSLQPIFLSEEQKRLVHFYQPEDVIHFRKEHKKMGIARDSYYTIQNIDHQSKSLSLKSDHGAVIHWKPSTFNVTQIETYRTEPRELREGDRLVWTKTVRDQSQDVERRKDQLATVVSLEKGNILLCSQEGDMISLDKREFQQAHFDYGYASLVSKASKVHAENSVLLISSRQVPLLDQGALSACIKQAKQFHVVCDDVMALQNVVVMPPTQNKVETEVENKNKVLEPVEYVCNRLSERSAVFTLEEAKVEAFMLAGLTMSKEEIDQGFKKAFDKGFLIDTGKKINQGTKTHSLITTQEQMLMEKGCLQLAVGAQDVLEPIITTEHPSIKSIENNERLTMGQKEAILLSITTTDRVIGIQGVAGSGKTTMLKEVDRISKEAGFSLMGLAHTAGAKNRIIDATKTLEDAGIPAMTMRKFMNQAEGLLERNPDLAKSLYGKNQIFVLDESSLVSTRDMLNLMTIVEKLDSRLLLIGDVKQLGAIEAGNPWHLLLGSDMKSVAMNENVRFKDPNAVAIMRDLYSARVDEAIEKLAKNTIEIPDREERLKAMATMYVAQTAEEREKTLIISPKNEDRLALNDEVRALLIKNGTLSGPEVQATVLLSKDMSSIEKSSFYSYSEGDYLRFNYTNRRLGIEVGDYCEVTGKNPITKQLILKTEGGGNVFWSPNTLPKWSGAIEVFSKETKSLMVGDKIRWKKNDENKGIFNGDMADLLKLEGNIAEVRLGNGEEIKLDLTRHGNQHWDHAYASTVFVAQGQDVPLTLGLCQGPEPVVKKTEVLCVNDVIVLPKELGGKSLNENNSKIAVVNKISINELTLRDRNNNFYSINMKDIDGREWKHYPSFAERFEDKLHTLPKSTNLSNFLVQATRGDNFVMFVDNVDYFKNTLKHQAGLKETAMRHLNDDWSKTEQKVDKMTENVTGKALNIESEKKLGCSATSEMLNEKVNSNACGGKINASVLEIQSNKIGSATKEAAVSKKEVKEFER